MMLYCTGKVGHNKALRKHMHWLGAQLSHPSLVFGLNSYANFHGCGVYDTQYHPEVNWEAASPMGPAAG